MPRTPLHKLVRPHFPPAAVGIESNSASVVQLDRARGGWVVRRAAAVNLPAELIKPGFDRTNISDQAEAARTLEDLVTSAGLLRQRKFSASLPEAATRSAIVTIEGAATSRRETEELFEWNVFNLLEHSKAHKFFFDSLEDFPSSSVCRSCSKMLIYREYKFHKPDQTYNHCLLISNKRANDVQ